MSFIAKNPLIIPEVQKPSSTPTPGMRGLFAKNDGWYEIDSDGNEKRLGGGSNIDDQTIIEDINKLKAIVDILYAKSLVKTVIISLPASAWVENSEKEYFQVVSIDGTTEYSKVDLQPTTEQLLIFHEKDITFVTENENGVITVYCIGQKPMNDYTMQATITEVEIDE